MILYKRKKKVCCFFFFNQKEVVLTRELATSNSGRTPETGFAGGAFGKPAISVARSRPLGRQWRDAPLPSCLQMAKLRTLYSSAENEPPVPLVRNWRPPQPIKGRIVKASFK